jgi:hypothetical protein
VYFDARYVSSMDWDFCMLKFTGPKGMPFIPVAGVTDGVTPGAPLEHVGYGATETMMHGTVRRSGTAPADQALTLTEITSTQGGSSHLSGTCAGDSGGPALLPAGVPQGQQTVVGVTSFGDAVLNCAMGSTNTAMRVSSETGPDGFITKFLSDTPIGLKPGVNNCSDCISNAGFDTCPSELTTCTNDPACTALDQCRYACTTQQCKSDCDKAAPQQAVDEALTYDLCVCNSCMQACGSSCLPEGVDAGETDGGSDAGASSMDGGDAGTCPDFDAGDDGDSDAGAADAGTVDAGGADAGGTDAGPGMAEPTPRGCGCASLAGTPALLLPAALSLRRRRARAARAPARA